MKLPNEYISRMKELLGNEAEEYFSVLDAEPARALRLNRIKLSGNLPNTEEVRFTPSGINSEIFLFDGPAGGRNPLHHAGAYYIQELSAMLPVLSAPVKRGWKILDLCAAPGGKTGQLAEAVGDRGFVAANEYSPKRAKALLGNVERMGYKNCAVYSSSPDKLCPAFGGIFDLVLVDAPCSGEGMFRREPEAVASWSAENSAGCALRQLEILRYAADCVKPGGYLLYSTCTFSAIEDEELLIRFLRENPHFSLTPLNPPQNLELSHGIQTDEYRTELCLRAYPHKIKGEGQFFGLMQRDSSQVSYHTESYSRKQNRVKKESNLKSRALTDKEIRSAQTFLTDFFGGITEFPLRAVGGDIFIPASDTVIPESGLLADGVRLGRVAADGRFIPHHHFFSAYGGSAALRLELAPDSPLITRYLHGESFPASDAGFDENASGWGAVTVCGCAVGGFRLAGGYVKNHYPKGLRN